MCKSLNALLFAAATLCATACTTVAPPVKIFKSAECVFPSTDKEAPPWVCDVPVEGMKIGAVGSAPKSEAGLDFMKQMAATSARTQLAQIIKVQVQNMIKQYAETTGAASKESVDRVNTLVTKQITNETLTGTKILRSIVAPDGSVFVLVGLDDAAFQTLTESSLRTSMNNDHAAWQQFRAQKGQEELAAEIAKQKMESENSKRNVEFENLKKQDELENSNEKVKLDKLLHYWNKKFKTMYALYFYDADRVLTNSSGRIS